MTVVTAPELDQSESDQSGGDDWGGSGDQWSARQHCDATLWASTHDYGGKRLYKMVNRGGIQLNCGTHMDQKDDRGWVLLHAYSKGADFAFMLYALTQSIDESYKVVWFTESESHAKSYLAGQLPAATALSQLADAPTVRIWAEQQAANISKDAIATSTMDAGDTPFFLVPERGTEAEAGPNAARGPEHCAAQRACQ